MTAVLWEVSVLPFTLGTKGEAVAMVDSSQHSTRIYFYFYYFYFVNQESRYDCDSIYTMI